jgi:tetratricopeptide (TPR) repeat protein
MMKKYLTLSLAALMCAQAAAAPLGQQKSQSQAKPSGTQAAGQRPAEAPPAAQQQRPAVPDSPDLNAYGIQVSPDPRIIAMMAALDAAGWDPTPEGASPSVFREAVRRDTAALDPVLRGRMREFFERYAFKDIPDDPKTADVNEAVRYTPADQAARYVSLAYTLGQPPDFTAPQRSDDLPSGVLDVLDFVPLLREFYKQSGMDARMSTYIQQHRAAGERLREPSVDMARSVLSYLNTRPETTIIERVKVTDASAKKKKDARPITVSHERDRRFRIVPDLLAAPGAINFRATGDDYYAIVPADIDPRQSEIRRAYLQFVIDPLVARFSRDVAARREEIKQLLERERTRKGRDLSPDIFLAVARSLVAAADVRMDAVARTRALQVETSRRLQAATTQAQKDAALADSKTRQAAIEDSATAQLADAYERGAVLSFYFAEQLKGLEGSGFDVSNFISPMVADFKPDREMTRPAEYASAVARVREARARAAAERASAVESAPADPARAALAKSLADVNELLRVRNYEEAETRLTALREQHRSEPLVYLALGQTASLSAQEAFDENLQAERLNKALAHFRQAILLSEPDTDRTIILRAHLASGRILAHLERNDDALKEFDAVINSSAPTDPFHQQAVAEKKKLGSPQQ